MNIPATHPVAKHMRVVRNGVDVDGVVAFDTFFGVAKAFKPDKNGAPQIANQQLVLQDVPGARLLLKESAPLWARLWFWWWRKTGVLV